ncbi:MAG: hypothetical protein KUG75_01665 [Pseudomonadales bacterium]|nr:hypothetical protein [Pseudomonadales bacterium]
MGQKTRHWKHNASISMYRSMRWAQRHIPPGIRTILGVLLMIGGLLGFLPILGFWMIPLGVAILSLDYPPLKNRIERKLKAVARIHRAKRNKPKSDRI